jgi:UDP-2,3-diacylglucosamine pyrophosphatase LpxH
MKNKSTYIIVSDIHLGSTECNQKEFCDFLKWIQSLENQPKIIKFNDNKITINPPNKIILLGDILELWDPKDSDRDNVIKDSMKPFSLLSDINCDKIYVVGNHDNSLGELEKKINYGILHNGTLLDIYNKHYPEIDKKSGVSEGIKIGDKSYFFLHGQQFDKDQFILTRVSQLIGENWNPLDWLQILYNIEFTKKHWKINFITFLALLFGGEFYLWNLFLKNYFWNAVAWASITSYFALSSIPGIVTHLQGWLYSLTNPKDKTAEQVITDKYYQESKDTINADVIVFGHTHFASSYELRSKVKKKLFINSGCWVKTDENIDGNMRYANTFIYLDEIGAYILTWHEAGNIECIEAFR